MDEPESVTALSLAAREGLDNLTFAPWHAGMAFAMGFIKAGLQALDAPRSLNSI